MAGDEPNFEQVDGSKLYAMPRTGSDRGWCGYLLARTQAIPGPSIGLEDSFNLYRGQYLFALSAPPKDKQVETWIGNVRTYLDHAYGWLSGGAFDGMACVWIADPTKPTIGPAGGYAFTFGSGPLGTIMVGQGVNNPLGAQLTLAVPNSVYVSVTASGLKLEGRPPSLVAFVTAPANQGPSVSPNKVVLPFTGLFSGCLLLAGQIVPNQTLDLLETGVRYTHGPSRAVTQVFPVVETSGATPIAFSASVDPLDPLNAAAPGDVAQGIMRTLFAAVGTSNGPPQLASWLRTACGQPVELVPHGGVDDSGQPVAWAGGFVLQSADPDGAPAPPNVYLAPAGDWGVAVDGAAAGLRQDLLCGLFGLERMSFLPYSARGACDRLRFMPGCAAYAPAFPFDPSSLTSPATSTDLLTTTYRTSWAQFVAAGAAVPYVAQPQSSPLYKVAGATSTSDDPALLGWYPAAVDLPEQAAPFAPYAGLAEAPQSFPAAELAPFESQIIAAERKRRLAPATLAAARASRAVRRAAGVAAETDDAVTTTTPQGFIVDLLGGDYEQVTLATSAAPTPLAFANVSAELQNLLQTNQIFAVIVDDSHVGTSSGLPGAPSFHNQVAMSGWTFAADVGSGSTGSDYRNVLIFKFGDGTLLDRVKNPAQWTDTRSFSLLPGTEGMTDAARLTGLSQWLQTYIQQAIDQANDGNTLFAPFAQVAQSSSWNGILALRTDVVKLPDQLEGLMAGIDRKALSAHHFGVTVTPVTVADGRPQLGPSSLFGLVDYQLPLFAQNVKTGGDPEVPLAVPVDGPFGFTVLQLQALFVNAGVADFHSRVQLTVKELFGAPVTSAYGTKGLTPTTAVVLDGRYQSQDGAAAYVFEQAAATSFVVRDATLQAVAFDRVQLNTLSAGDPITSRFLIWGTFDFACLPDGKGNAFDVMSFGSPASTQPPDLGQQGLAFSNLHVDMSSPHATPNAVTYRLDASGLAFDLNSSRARDGSLFPGLALQLDSFLAAPAGKRPADYGYLPVSTAVNASQFDGAWFGVVCKVTMGTPGALVAKAGFESRMLLGWAPQPDASLGYYLATGLKLPGAAPGAKLLSLQGVLKLSIDSITLVLQDVAGHPGVKAFALQLRNVGLKFLGLAKLPPGAAINFFLFGPLEGSGSLGWYAAYVAESEKGVALLEEARP